VLQAAQVWWGEVMDGLEWEQIGTYSEAEPQDLGFYMSAAASTFGQ